MEREKLVRFLQSVDRHDLLYVDESVDALLGMLHEWTEPWATKTREGSDADRVLYALHPENGKWAAARVPAHEVPLWVALNVSPSCAKRWVDAGLGVADATVWSAITDLNELDPVVVASWAPFADLPIADVAEWVGRGVAGDLAAKWVYAGWGDEWVEDVVKWMNAFGDFDPADVYVNYDNERPIALVREWAKYGIIGEELELFERKGYTPYEAAKLWESGVSGEDAPVDAGRNERLAAKVPGRSWSTIWKRAQEHGWDIEKAESYHRKDLILVDLVRTKDGAKVRIWIENGKFWRSSMQQRSRCDVLKMRELLAVL
jgi:hypothetical protein